VICEKWQGPGELEEARTEIAHFVRPGSASGAGSASVASMLHSVSTAPAASIVKVACTDTSQFQPSSVQDRRTCSEGEP